MYSGATLQTDVRKMPAFTQRAPAGQEMMDDFSTSEELVREGLLALAQTNRWLGGYAASKVALKPLVSQRSEVSLLDLGTGLADHPAELIPWADEYNCRLTIVAIDANPVVVEFAEDYIQQNLSPAHQERLTLDVADALELDLENDSFDVVHAALFLHHFSDHDAVRILREMDRLAANGIVVSDLHRHPVAYYGLILLGQIFSAPEMFTHDGPLSIRRGYLRHELRQLADFAGIAGRGSIQWRWAFRWILSTLNPK